MEAPLTLDLETDLRTPPLFLPCAMCGEMQPAAAEICQDCGGDPAATQLPCFECVASPGEITVSDPNAPWLERQVTCPNCAGEEFTEPPFIQEREIAKGSQR